MIIIGRCSRETHRDYSSNRIIRMVEAQHFCTGLIDDKSAQGITGEEISTGQQSNLVKRKIVFICQSEVGANIDGNRTGVGTAHRGCSEGGGWKIMDAYFVDTGQVSYSFGERLFFVKGIGTICFEGDNRILFKSHIFFEEEMDLVAHDDTRYDEDK